MKRCSSTSIPGPDLDTRPPKFFKSTDGSPRAKDGAENPEVIDQKFLFNDFDVKVGMQDTKKKNSDALTILELTDINAGETVTLTNSYSNLQKLHVNVIKGRLELPYSLNNLETFTIEHICDTEIHVPSSLKTVLLTIQKIKGKVQILLPDSRSNPIRLRIYCMEEESDLKIIDKFNNLVYLVFKKIGEKVNISLPDCRNCEFIAFEKVPSTFSYEYPSEFNVSQLIFGDDGQCDIGRFRSCDQSLLSLLWDRDFSSIRNKLYGFCWDRPIEKMKEELKPTPKTEATKQAEERERLRREEVINSLLNRKPMEQDKEKEKKS